MDGRIGLESHSPDAAPPAPVEQVIPPLLGDPERIAA